MRNNHEHTCSHHHNREQIDTNTGFAPLDTVINMVKAKIHEEVGSTDLKTVWAAVALSKDVLRRKGQCTVKFSFMESIHATATSTCTCGVDNQLRGGVHMGQDKPGYTTSTVLGDTGDTDGTGGSSSASTRDEDETEGEEEGGRSCACVSFAGKKADCDDTWVPKAGHPWCYVGGTCAGANYYGEGQWKACSATDDIHAVSEEDDEKEKEKEGGTKEKEDSNPPHYLKPQTPKPRPPPPGVPPRICCKAMTAVCLACANGQSVKQFCAERPAMFGCDKTSRGPNVPTDPTYVI